MSSQAPAGPTGRLRFTSPLALSLTFVIIFGGAWLIAWTSYPAQAAAMPLIISGVGAVLSLLQVFVELRASRNPDYEERVDLKKDLGIYLWVWAFVLAIIAFGFLWAAPPMLFIYLRFRSGESWRLSILLAVVVWGLFYGLFETVLGVTLFEGLITPMVGHWMIPPS
jgi:hypothetical protein